MLILPGKSASWAAGGSSFTETEVLVSNGDHITASAALGAATYKSILFFASVNPSSADESSRMMLNSFQGIQPSIYANHDAGGSSFGLKIDLLDDNGGRVLPGAEPVSTSARYHVLLTAWHDGTDFKSRAYVYDTSGSTWATLWDGTTEDLDLDTATGGTFLNLGSGGLRIFQRTDSSLQNYIGSVWRQALWASTSASEIANIASSTVRDRFTSGSNIADPALTQSDYSAHDRIYDLSGSATNYNITGGTAGGDTGTLTFTAAGTFANA